MGRISPSRVGLMAAAACILMVGLSYSSSSEAVHIVKRSVTAQGLTDSLRTALYHAKDEGFAGLKIWMNLATNIRGYLRTGKTISMTSGGDIDIASTIKGYLLPSAIMAAIMFVWAILWLFTDILTLLKHCCRLCAPNCCRCCCQTPPYPMGKKRKVALIGLMTAISFVYLAAFISGLSASTTLNDGLSYTSQAITSIGVDAVVQLDAVQPTVTAVLASTINSLFNLIDSIGNNLGIAAFISTVSGTVGDIVSTMTTTGTIMQDFKTNGTDVDAQLKVINETIEDYTSNFVADLAVLKNLLTTMQNPGGASSGYQVKALVAQPVTDKIDEAETSTSSQDYSTFPNVTDYMADYLPPNTPDLIVQAQSIQNQFDTLSTTIPETYHNATNGFRGTLNSTFDDINNGLQGFLDMSSYTSQISDFQSTISGYQTDYIDKYAPIIRYVAIGLFAFVALVTVVNILGAGFRRPRVMKTATYPFMLLVIIYCLLAGVLFIVASVIGDVCYWTDDSRQLGDWMPIIDRLTDSDYSSSVGKIFNARKQCVDGVSILDVLIDADVGISAQDVNITSQADTQLNALNFADLVNSFDIGDAFTLGGDISTQLSHFTAGGGISGSFQFDDFIAEAEKSPFNSSFIDYMKTFTDNLAESDLQSSDTMSQLTIDLNDLKAKLNTRLTTMTTRLQTVNNTVSAASARMVTDMRHMQSMAAEVDPLVVDLLGNYTLVTQQISDGTNDMKTNFINVIIPNLKTDIHGLLNSAQTQVLASLSCNKIALDTYAVQNSMCYYINGAFDAFWFSFYIVGFFSFMAVLVWFKVAERIAVRVHGENLPFFRSGKGKNNKSNGRVSPADTRDYPEMSMRQAEYTD